MLFRVVIYFFFFKSDAVACSRSAKMIHMRKSLQRDTEDIYLLKKNTDGYANMFQLNLNLIHK